MNDSTSKTVWVINPVSGMPMGRVPDFDHPLPEDCQFSKNGGIFREPGPDTDYSKALNEYWECVGAVYGDGVYLCEAVMGDYTESERKLMRDCQCWEVIDL